MKRRRGRSDGNRRVKDERASCTCTNDTIIIDEHYIRQITER